VGEGTDVEKMKYIVLPGFEIRTIQPVANHYIEYAIWSPHYWPRT